MAVELERFAETVAPERTVLLFGAGSSIPSGAPSAAKLTKHLSESFGIPDDGFSLAEVASLVEQRASRPELIRALRQKLRGLRPTGGLLNLPLFEWKSLYTTNYDNIIEESYRQQGRELIVYSSDFDFTLHDSPAATKLFKLHGTIEKDVSDGNSSRLIITDTDYDNTAHFRDSLWNRLKGDMVGNHLIIVGHSLQDPDIKDVVTRAADRGSRTPGAWKVSLLLYVADENRAQLFEKRGFGVCFGSVDSFLGALSRRLPVTARVANGTDALAAVPVLRATTLDVEHASSAPADFSAMFNGWPATHADIVAGHTFDRTVAEEMAGFLQSDESMCGVLLGASGVGKTTAARQAIQRLRTSGYRCWEHQPDQSLNARAWVEMARHLREEDARGVLAIDDAHSHLPQINDFLNSCVADQIYSLRLLCVSSRNLWNPRMKSPHLFKLGRVFKLGHLGAEEIERLLNLVDSQPEVRRLVEPTFSGFSRHEQRRRLKDRCESEPFVCLKNIFASEKFDDIILREYASLSDAHQEIYRHVAAMQSAGVRVHRQLVMRLLGVPGEEVSSVLNNLADIIHEYTVSEREGIYGWRGRHPVIVDIVARHKFKDIDKRVALYTQVIDNLAPTYEIEILTARELCNPGSGVLSIPDKVVRNTLLRMLISAVPGERVPRHRLIRNLIEMGEYEKAETEIRVFERDFRNGDAPVARYKIELLVARATRSPGLMQEDRLSILDEARGLAENCIERFPFSKGVLKAYCEVGVAVLELSGEYSVYDSAIAQLKLAEERIGDPEIGRLVGRYEARVRGAVAENGDMEDADA